MEDTMTLHTNKVLFDELITRTSEQMGISEVYIEKDYWVTMILHSLSRLDDALKKQVVFKGGTSLSKAHRIVERFSEDIDLAVIADDLGGHQTKKLLKKIEKALVGAPFVELLEHPQMGKGSEIRKSVHQYPQFVEGDFGDAVDVIILELNTFAHPTPNRLKPIHSYIYEFLSEEGANEVIAQYTLEPFEVFVLDIERTLCEKISAIARASYEGDAELQRKIRHFYDIHLLLQKAQLQDFLQSPAFEEMMTIVKSDDTDNKQFNDDWSSKPLTEAPIYNDTIALIDRLEPYYYGDFKKMVYGELPSIEDVKESILLVKGRLHE